MSVGMVCAGCGASLQMDSPGEAGYITGTAFLHERPLCQRCYRLQHYGEFSPGGLSEQDYRAVVMRVLSRPSMVVYIVDLFDFHGSLMRGMDGVLRPHEVILAANKVDLLPAGSNVSRLRTWVLREARRAGVSAREAILVSAETGSGTEELWSRVRAAARERQVVAIGMANVGKSSLLNRLLSRTGEREAHELTASRYPGTTLGAVAMKLRGGSTLVDTPGLLANYRLQDRLAPESLKSVVPRSVLRPRVYQLRPEQSLFLGGLARFDFLEGEPQPFVVYAANDLTVHRTARKNADELYLRQAGTLLRPPTEGDDPSLQALFPKNMSFIDGMPVDVAIAGLGWIRLSGRAGKYRLHLPKGVESFVRPPLILSREAGGSRSNRARPNPERPNRPGANEPKRG